MLVKGFVICTAYRCTTSLPTDPRGINNRQMPLSPGMDEEVQGVSGASEEHAVGGRTKMRAQLTSLAAQKATLSWILKKELLSI